MPCRAVDIERADREQKPGDKGTVAVPRASDFCETDGWRKRSTVGQKLAVPIVT